MESDQRLGEPARASDLLYNGRRKDKVKSYDDIVREVEEVKDTERELEGLVPVWARVSPNAGSVYSTRYSNEELSLILEAAKKRGLTGSAFIRAAALAAAAGELDLGSAEKAATLQQVRAKARDLVETVNRL